ncbi:MAG: hypothetical protein ACE5FT_02790 [Candidatus Nanoarchaeia archaeon]
MGFALAVEEPILEKKLKISELSETKQVLRTEILIQAYDNCSLKAEAKFRRVLVEVMAPYFDKGAKRGESYRISLDMLKEYGRKLCVMDAYYCTQLYMHMNSS